MAEKTLSKLLIERFGLNLFKKSCDFPNNKINIISLETNPIKVKAIVLDEDREFHLNIDEENYEIFHDCPIFLVHSEFEDKICVHILKLLLMLDNSLSQKILSEIKNYKLTSEDFGSKRKSHNFLILASSCLDESNYIEGLNYLNKAIINQYECEPIIERYLRIALENNLFIEFFEFLKNSYENDLEDQLIKFENYINKGFKRILDVIGQYSFYNVLRIIKFIDKVLEKYKFSDISFLGKLIDKLITMENSDNFNEKYFSFYFIKKNYDRLREFEPHFENLIVSEVFESFKKKLLKNFQNEIDSFSIIEKIKLMKRQFETFNIPKKDYYKDYKRYKSEIKGLKRKVYLRKFAYLKILIEQHNIRKTKVNLRKKRNTYVVNHNKQNLKIPVYNYIINHIGFYGLNDSTIKSSELGINYLIVRELFIDDLSNFPDIFYYKNQFWGEDEYSINIIDGYSLIPKPTENAYETIHNLSSVDEIIIIEWDLANKPIHANIVNAYGSKILIPDQNNSLFHDLKPFDLCFCQKNPIKIEGNIIKTINVITKCSFKDAVNSISKGMDFIEGYYPLSVIKQVLNKKISPFEADEKVFNNPKKSFIPNYQKFIKTIREFLFNFIFKEKEYVFEKLKLSPDVKSSQILTLLNLTNELAGLDLDYMKIIEKLFSQELTLKQFRSSFLTEVESLIKEILKKREPGTTNVFNLNKMKNTPFIKYSEKILKIRENEFENSIVFKILNKNDVKYNIKDLNKTYYGQKFGKILGLKKKNIVKQDIMTKINEFANRLNLKISLKEQREIHA